MTEGEAWARTALEQLRAAHYRPRAWGRFLADSFSRARERRRERPRAHRITLVLGSAGLAAWAGAAGWPLLALVGAAWWAAAMLMLDWHLGMLERPDGMPLGGIGAANLLTLLRAGLPPALFALAATDVGLALFAAASASDVLDGVIARGRNEITRLGIWLDPAVDGLVLGAAALGAMRAGLIADSVAALVVVRYALPWLVVAIHYFAKAEPPRRAAFVSGRVSGLVLYTGLALALLRLPGATPLIVAGAAAGLATVAASVVLGFRLPPAPATALVKPGRDKTPPEIGR